MPRVERRLTDADIAELLGRSVRSIRRLVRSTPPDVERPWRRVGRVRRWLDDSAALDAWLASLEQPTGAVTVRRSRRRIAKGRSAADVRRSWRLLKHEGSAD